MKFIISESKAVNFFQKLIDDKLNYLKSLDTDSPEVENDYISNQAVEDSWGIDKIIIKEVTKKFHGIYLIIDIEKTSWTHYDKVLKEIGYLINKQLGLKINFQVDNTINTNKDW